MIDIGQEAVKIPRSHLSIPLINVIRIQLNNTLRQLLNTSVARTLKQPLAGARFLPFRERPSEGDETRAVQ